MSLILPCDAKSLLQGTWAHGWAGRRCAQLFAFQAMDNQIIHAHTIQLQMQPNEQNIQVYLAHFHTYNSSSNLDPKTYPL